MTHADEKTPLQPSKTGGWKPRSFGLQGWIIATIGSVIAAVLLFIALAGRAPARTVSISKTAWFNPAWATDPSLLADIASALRAGRPVVIPEFLEPALAEQLHMKLTSWTGRSPPMFTPMHAKTGPSSADIDTASFHNLGRQHACRDIARAEQHGFHYFAHHLNESVLPEVHTFAFDIMSRAIQPAALDLITKLSGAPVRSIAHDWIAHSFNWFKKGEFFELHSDYSQGRYVAFTIQLAKDWQPEWGGGFGWCGRDVDHAYVVPPQFNQGVLFLVGEESNHFVEPVWVDPHSTARLSIQGWYVDPCLTDDWWEHSFCTPGSDDCAPQFWKDCPFRKPAFMQGKAQLPGQSDTDFRKAREQHSQEWHSWVEARAHSAGPTPPFVAVHGSARS